MKPVVVILVHGFSVMDPRTTVGRFRKYFESMSCMVETFTYGYVPFTWQITKRNPKIAEEFAGRVAYWKGKGYRVYVAAHSNGCVITRLACETRGSEIDRLLAMHPALRPDLHPASSADRVLVVHNQGDNAVVAGGWLGRLSRWIFPESWTVRPWGQQGQDGYSEYSRTVRNINTGNKLMYDPIAWGHSDEFSANKEAYFLPMLAHMLVEDD